MANNQQRREAYRYYRSMGYSANESRNMRNRGRDTLLTSYREAKRDYTDSRIARYSGESKELQPKPYRPTLELRDSEIQEYYDQISEYNVNPIIIDQMLDGADFLKADLYTERIEKLSEFFDISGFMEWDELMDYLSDIQDLGDWFSLLEEFYDEVKGGK